MLPADKLINRVLKKMCTAFKATGGQDSGLTCSHVTPGRDNREKIKYAWRGRQGVSA